MFKFGSWNVNDRRLRQAHADLIQIQAFDLLALQEVSREFHEALSKTDLFHWNVSSLNLRPPLPDDRKSRRLGVSIFGRAPFELATAEIMRQLDFPERALVAQTSCPKGAVTACSFHIPPGANWGNVKTITQRAIVDWLGTQDGSLIFGIDANAPGSDPPNAAERRLWPLDEPYLLQLTAPPLTPKHELRDAYRVFLDSNPVLFDQICRQRPNGPLAISHYRGRGAQRTACRYDFIFTSRKIGVEKVEYIFDRTLSDHALVAGSFNLSGR